VGRYLGEICRLILVDAVRDHGLFDGHMPRALEKRWSFSTKTMGIIESDHSDDMKEATHAFTLDHAIKSKRYLKLDDIRFVQHICSLVSNRAAALVAGALIALSRIASPPSPKTNGHMTNGHSEQVCVSFCGSVIEKYPTFRKRVQEILDEAYDHPASHLEKRICLEPTGESGLLGAAMGAAMTLTTSTNGI